jgi:hypothetical protein
MFQIAPMKRRSLANIYLKNKNPKEARWHRITSQQGQIPIGCEFSPA